MQHFCRLLLREVVFLHEKPGERLGRHLAFDGRLALTPDALFVASGTLDGLLRIER